MEIAPAFIMLKLGKRVRTSLDFLKGETQFGKKCVAQARLQLVVPECRFVSFEFGTRQN